MAMDEKQDQVIRYAMAQLEINGAATIGVKDGQLFMFSKAKLLEFLKDMEDSGEEKVVIFVKRGEIDLDAGSNN